MCVLSDAFIALAMIARQRTRSSTRGICRDVELVAAVLRELRQLPGEVVLSGSSASRMPRATPPVHDSVAGVLASANG
jgi:hypothetical protein